MSPTAREVSKDAHHIFFILQALHVIDFKRLIPFNKDTKKKKKRKREEFNEQKLCPKFYFFLTVW